MSRKKAIDEMCKSCNFDPLDRGNWRQQITSCTITDCALYPYRPKSSGKLIEPLKTDQNGA